MARSPALHFFTLVHKKKCTSCLPCLPPPHGHVAGLPGGSRQGALRSAWLFGKLLAQVAQVAQVEQVVQIAQVRGCSSKVGESSTLQVFLCNPASVNCIQSCTHLLTYSLYNTPAHTLQKMCNLFCTLCFLCSSSCGTIA